MDPPTFMTLCSEYREDGRWQAGPGFSRTGETFELAPPFMSRDHALFGFLAGVRACGPTTLAPPRGLPEDASEAVAAVAAEEAGHNHTWFMKAELLEGIRRLELEESSRRLSDLTGPELEAALVARAMEGGLEIWFPDFQGFLQGLVEESRVVCWFQGHCDESLQSPVATVAELRELLYDRLALGRFRGINEFYGEMTRMARTLGPSSAAAIVGASSEEDPWLRGSLSVLVLAYESLFPVEFNQALQNGTEAQRSKVNRWLGD